MNTDSQTTLQIEDLMDSVVVAEIILHFQALSSVIPLHAIYSEPDYDKAVKVLNQLLDAGAADEAHPLTNLVYILGGLIGEYDAQHYPIQNERLFHIEREIAEELADEAILVCGLSCPILPL
jgi:hypothetical protein